MGDPLVELGVGVVFPAELVKHLPVLQEQHPSGAAGCLLTAALQVDQQDGQESQEHAGHLHSAGTLPKDQHGHGGGHEHAQLHEGGGEHHAVAGDVPLEQQKAAQIHCAADQPKPDGEGDALPRQGHRSGEGGGQNRTHQVIARKHARAVMDARFAQPHQHGYQHAAENCQNQIDHGRNFRLLQMPARKDG